MFTAYTNEFIDRYMLKFINSEDKQDVKLDKNSNHVCIMVYFGALYSQSWHWDITLSCLICLHIYDWGMLPWYCWFESIPFSRDIWHHKGWFKEWNGDPLMSTAGVFRLQDTRMHKCMSTYRNLVIPVTIEKFELTVFRDKRMLWWSVASTNASDMTLKLSSLKRYKELLCFLCIWYTWFVNYELCKLISSQQF